MHYEFMDSYCHAREYMVKLNTKVSLKLAVACCQAIFFNVE